MRKGERCDYQYFKNADKKQLLPKRGRKVDNEWEKCRERTRLNTRSFPHHKMLTQASVRKTLDISNYFNQEGIHYNSLGIREIMTKITAACVFAERYKMCPLIQRKIN